MPVVGRVFWMWLKRDIKSRYVGSFGGLAWAVLAPLFTILLFYVLFSKIFLVKVPEIASEAGFFYYLLAGILPWLAISEGLSRGTGVIVAHEQFLQKQAFAVGVLPSSVVVAGLLPQLVGTLLFAVLILLSPIPVTAAWLLWPLVLGLQLAMILGLTLLLSVLAVHLRDLLHAIPVLLQFFFYATPILYPMSMVPESYHWLYLLNPFAPLVQAYHAVLLGTSFSVIEGLALVFWALVLGLGGYVGYRILLPTVGESL